MVTDVSDVLMAIGLADKPVKKKEIVASNKEEHIIMRLINDGVLDSEDIFKNSGLEASTYNQTLTMLEITGKIKPAGNDRWFLT